MNNIFGTIAAMLATGMAFGFAGAITYFDRKKWRTDQALLAENEHLRDEVLRLRAQVAKHIGAEK